MKYSIKIIGLLIVGCTCLLRPNDCFSYHVAYNYYVYATNSDGIPIMDNQILQDQTYVDGNYTKTGDFGNFGSAMFMVDLLDKSISVTAQSHGLQINEYNFAVGTGRVEKAEFFDYITFTAAEGTYVDGLYATMTGYMQGRISSDVAAGARCQCVVYFGPEVFDTGLLETGVEVSQAIIVDETFNVILEIVPPGTTLNQPTNYLHQVRLGFYNGRTWSNSYNPGSGYVTGDGNIDFLDGLRITSLTATPGVTWVSESGAFEGGVSSVPASAQMQLHQNVPNPFNPSTTIEYTLMESGQVNLTVFDISGQLVRTLVDMYLDKGPTSVLWNGTDSTGKQVGSGTYFYRLETGGFTETKRMTLVK